MNFNFLWNYFQYLLILIVFSLLLKQIGISPKKNQSSNQKTKQKNLQEYYGFVY